MSEERIILNWENDEKADALDKTRWAHDFEWSELEILAGYMLAVEFSEGAVLFREREPGSFHGPSPQWRSIGYQGRK